MSEAKRQTNKQSVWQAAMAGAGIAALIRFLHNVLAGSSDSPPPQPPAVTQTTATANTSSQGRSTEDPAQPDKAASNAPAELPVATQRHPGLQETVTPLDGPPVEVDGIIVRLIGAEFGTPGRVGQGRRPEWKSSDDRTVAEAAAYGFGQGLAEGLLGLDKEREKRDAELALYFEMKLASDSASPRDAKTADIKVRVQDDQGAVGLEVDKTYGWGLMKPGETYIETLKLAVYSDSKRFTVQLDGATWVFDAPPFIQ